MEDIGQIEPETFAPEGDRYVSPYMAQAPVPMCEEVEIGEWELIASGTRNELVPERKLAIIAHDVGDITSVTEGAASLGVNIYRSSLLRQALWDVMRAKDEWIGAILVYSHFGPIGVNFDLIRSFRRRAPSTPLILLSQELTKDDLTTERLPLCDISLRLPIDLSYLTELMDAAEINNSAWVSRCRELRRQ